MTDVRADGESWESYARRLEHRIKEQRDQINSVHRYRETNGNRADRKRIRRLRFALGRMTERWEHERSCREALVAEKEGRSE